MRLPRFARNDTRKLETVPFLCHCGRSAAISQNKMGPIPSSEMSNVKMRPFFSFAFSRMLNVETRPLYLITGPR